MVRFITKVKGFNLFLKQLVSGIIFILISNNLTMSSMAKKKYKYKLGIVDAWYLK